MKKGKITQVIGAVLDIRFLGEQVPDIHEPYRFQGQKELPKTSAL